MPDKRNRTDDAKAEAAQGNYDRNSEPFKRGQISHCDIPALDGCDLVGNYRVVFRYGSYGNDMHYRVYGYYKKKLPAGSDPRFCLLKKFVNKKVQFF